MKILNIHKTITPDQLLQVLQQKLNPLFKQRRQTDIDFIIENKGGVIEISQPDLYKGFLFRIEIKGWELRITRRGDYIDDVNALTLESVLNEIFAELAGDGTVTLVLEG
ncbi:MAG TPA: hypothetical protein VIM16_08815 [Mucilaginibacter sp.]|jgi:hypothetical protein